MRETAAVVFLACCVTSLYRVECDSNKELGIDRNTEKQCENNSCEPDEGPCLIPREKGLLTRLSGVEVGHKQEVNLRADGKKVLITRALKPLIFEIPNFLSDEECDHIASLANESQLVSSVAKHALNKDSKWKFDPTLRGKADGPRGLYENWDFDQDGNITIEEFKKFGRIQRYLYLNDEEVKQVFKDLNLTELDDGVVTRQEFEQMNSMLIDSYLYEMGLSHPRHRKRFSDQTWLIQELDDTILQRIRQRVQALTKLPDEIIYGGEYLQVVRYGIDGHYHAHFDSEPHDEHSEILCCHQSPMAGANGATCKLCRYITILYFLNEVPEGGETAFPMADNATFDNEYLESIRSQEDLYNLSEYCHKANLVVTPRKGTAIMWYNHHIDPDNGWLGERDSYSLHGGCAVKSGFKWIANNWITAPYKNKAHVPSQYLYMLGPDEYFAYD